MESELMRNGFYDSNWDDFRAYYQPDLYQHKDDTSNYLLEVNKYPEVKAIFIRNEWVLPPLIRSYKSIIATGEDLKREIESYLN